MSIARLLFLQIEVSQHSCMYVRIYSNIHIYVHKYVRIHKHMSIEIPYVHIYVLTYVCICIHSYICLNVPTQSSERVLQKVSRVLLNSLAEVACLRQYIHTYLILYTNVHTNILRMCVLIRLSGTQKGDRVLENRTLFVKNKQFSFFIYKLRKL